MNETLKQLPKRMRQARIWTGWLFNEAIDRISPNPAILQCPICDYNAAFSQFKLYYSRCIFRGGRLVRYECPNCGAIFGTQRMLAMSADRLAREYSLHYSCYNEGDSTESELRTFRYLNPTPEGVYLNFGCGKWSKSVAQLRAQGYNIFGFEPHARGTVEEPFLLTRLEDFEAMKFDGIISNDVLEHLRHPEQILAFLSSLLKDEGVMAHSTHCYQYSHEFTRFHLFFFTGDSLSRICHKANLTYEDTDRADTKIFKKSTQN